MNAEYKSYVKNCVVRSCTNDQAGPLFFQRGDVIACRLDGYAIIPKEEYERLTAGKGAEQ